MEQFKPNQIAALKKLEAALLSVKRAGLVMVGIDDTLMATVGNEDFLEAAQQTSACEVILERNNSGHPLIHEIKHYDCYRDSGGA